MTKSKIEQKPVTWQDIKKILRRRIDHLGLLVGALKDTIASGHDVLNVNLSNSLQTAANRIENLRQGILYKIEKQDDIERQKQNKLLNIKDEK